MSKKKDIQPYWRPNIRIVETLPDIKVVRTDFIINFVALTLVLVTGSYLLQREYRAFVLKGTISKLEQRVRISEADDKISLGLNGRFRNAANHVLELKSFYNAPIKPYDLIAELTDSKPEGMLFTKLSFSENVGAKQKKLSFKLGIGCEVPDLTVLNAFKSVLSDSEVLHPEGFETSIVESFQARNAVTGYFPCRVSIEFEPLEGKVAKGKAGT